MAESILFNLAGNIITKLGSLALQELSLLWGVPEELDKLKSTLSAIQAVLLDAEEQQSKGNNAAEVWISNLKDALYDIDDLFDELSYETLRRQVMARDNGRKTRKQVRMFFSKSNPIVFALKMGHKIKEIRERLKDIDIQKTQFNLSERVNTRDDGLRKARETSYKIFEEEVIGRNDDKEAIINLLLKPNTKEHLAVISIVGMGGLGKTALAQSVFNCNTLKNHFELKLWVCISEEFDVKFIIEKIIESATKKRPESFIQISSLYDELKKEIGGKKYLLVMDDVWNENYENWVTLKRSLMDGAKGSRILITTRSEQVAKTFDTSSLYSLKQLDEDNSWLLFKKMTCLEGSGEDLENSNFVEIGREIVAKLQGIPLAIRTIGRLLYNKKTKKFWSSFKDKELYQIMEQGGVRDMLSILKLSYDHLPSKLKQCFHYCALFSKDFEIRKDEVIMQWVAQGFIQTYDNDKLIDIGENYFMELLSMSFFQDVTKDALGDIITCKMHDLIHDLACSIVQNECVHDVNARLPNKRTHHVSFGLMSWEELEKLPETLFEAKNLRTCFMEYNQFSFKYNNFNKIFESAFCNLLRLRTLDLQLRIDNHDATFLRCISKLKHLRYLKITRWRVFNFFLNSITGLYNLEVLIIRCTSLKELPKDIKNWNKLKHLYLSGNEVIEFNSIFELNNLETFVLEKGTKLKEFPREIKNLTNLTHLHLNGNENIEFLPNSISKLTNLEKLILKGYKKVKELPQDIKNLIHLQHLDLQGNSNMEFLPNSITKLCELKTLILCDCKKLKELPRDVKNWINLRHLDLSWSGVEFLPDSVTQLKNLETLLLRYCVKFKEFPRDIKKLINLKQLDIDGCSALTHMPKGIGRLTNLQTLNIFVLGKRENNGGGLSELNGLNKLRGSFIITGLQFCSAVDLQANAKLLQLKSGLQELVLEWKWDDNSSNKPTVGALDDGYEKVLECLQPHSNLQKIRIYGYKGVKLCNWLSSSSYSFNGLVSMELLSCERLQHLPQFHQFPNLKDLRLEDLPCIEHIGSNDYPSSSTFFPSLERLRLSHVPNLKSWWKKGQTSSGSTQNCVLFPITFPCLSTLWVSNCPLLTSVTCDAPSKSSEINDSIEYNIDPNDELDVVSWKSFQSLSYLQLESVSEECEFLVNYFQHVTTLRLFSIVNCPCLTSLPESISNLTSLSELDINKCSDLMSLPKSIANLTSLTKLEITYCKNLTSLPESMGKLTSLTKLEIKNCKNLMSLPESMGNLTSLTELTIRSCQKLPSLPEGIRHLHCLQWLTISECPILEERCKKEEGEDWLKIAHIPNIYIEGTFL